MRGDSWPTADQTLLLQAVLLNDAIGDAALERWLARVDLDHLDRGSRRLLPMLLHRLPAEDPLVPRIRDARIGAATENAELVNVAASAIARLGHAGIDTMVLKGMALIARGVMAPSDRPMSDCDLLVPEADAIAARDVLVAGGWRAEDRVDREMIGLRHAATLRNADHRQIDLHWHVLAECCEAGADRDFWNASQPAMLGGEGTRTLSAADMVLHACVHGVRWSIVPPIRWVVDAVSVIRAEGPGFDWARLADQAERRTLVLPAIDTLKFLRDTLGTPVPDIIVDRLERVSVPRWARAEYRVKTQRRSRPRQALYHWFLHRRLNRDRSLVDTALRFPTYLRRRFRSAADSGRAAGQDAGPQTENRNKR